MQPNNVCGFLPLALVLLLGDAVTGQAVNGYYIRNSDNWLVHITDLSNPAGTQICKVSGLFFAGDFKSGQTDKIYAIKYTDNTLHTISTTDCADTPIGPTADAELVYSTGMTWTEAGTMYVTFADWADPTTFHEGTVDTGTGHYSEYVTGMWPQQLLDIAFDDIPATPGQAGVYHLAAEGAGLFTWHVGAWEAEPLPGASDPVAFAGGAAPGGMSHDPTTGKLLAIGVDSGTGREQLLEIDRSTGAVAKRYTSMAASNAACLCFGAVVATPHSAECIARPKS
ncbi:hypothetical protein Pelo_7595 [Pelomyxa schiedti]|nr:hypothetical protein Pelo_7595 [Pelomyxa schiedti]